MTSTGGSAALEPHVYLIFWGGKWNEEPAKAERQKLVKMFEEINGSAWQGVLTQYWAPAKPANPEKGSVFNFISKSLILGTPYVDTVHPVPSGLKHEHIKAEIAEAIKANKSAGWAQEPTINDQFMVFTQPGAIYDTEISSGNYCGTHSTIENKYAYSLIGWGGIEAGNPFSNCLMDVTASHEYAESVTDPLPNTKKSAWRDHFVEGIGEVADLCGHEERGTMPSGSKVAALWDNQKNGCAQGDAAPAQFAPKILTEPATGVTAAKAKLLGAVTLNGLEIESYRFKWGTSMSYSNLGFQQPAGNLKFGPYQEISGLERGTTYHYRIYLEAEGELLFGEDRTFTTLDGRPVVKTEAPTNVVTDGATMNGTVNPEGSATTYSFQYGTSEAYGSKTSTLSAGSGTSDQKVSATLSGLEPGVTYHYRVVASNTFGTSYGVDKTFQPGWTLSPAPTPLAAKESLLRGVACPSTTMCEAVGYESNLSGAQNAIAEKWDGMKWSIEYPPKPKEGRALWLEGLSCWSTTDCFAVGSYEDKSGMRKTLVEKWNGTQWGAVPTPNPEGAKASRFEGVSCSSSTSCMAVGYYENSSGVLISLAERWDGTEWTIKATLNPEGTQENRLTGVSCSFSICMAVGYYKDSGGSVFAFSERWSGTAWALKAIPNPSGAKESRLESVSCPSSTFCMTAGSYKNVNGNPGSLIEGWNGTEWSIKSVPFANEAALEGVSCTQSAFCRASGYYKNLNQKIPLAAAWNGTNWTLQFPPQPGSLAAVACASGNACTAVGYYENSKTESTTVADRWTTKWNSQTTVNTKAATQTEFADISCATATTCVSVGRHNANAESLPLAESLEGGKWSIQPTSTPVGMGYSQLHTVSCPLSTFCMAAGDAVPPGETSGSAPFAETWNGEEWMLMAMPSPAGAQNTWITGVSCVSASACEASGRYENSFGAVFSFAAGWNGMVWTLQSTPNPMGAKESRFDDVSCASANVCKAVGSYEDSSGVTHGLAGTWNGSSWQVQAVPGPAGAQLAMLMGVSCPSATACTAVGFYRDSAEVIKALADRWNGSSWEVQQAATPASGAGSALSGVSCTSETFCMAVGDYDASNNPEQGWVSRPYAEAWKGATWSAQPVPFPETASDGLLLGVSCTSPIECMASGRTSYHELFSYHSNPLTVTF
jgi:hypothetical protein